MNPIGTAARFSMCTRSNWSETMLSHAKSFHAKSLAVERSGYARLLRKWAAAQQRPEARHDLMRLADAQDRSVDALLDLPLNRSPEHTLH